MYEPLLSRVREIAAEFLTPIDDRRVNARARFSELVAALGGPVPDTPEDPLSVIERIARDLDPGLMATPGPRYFGFVTGGSVPAAVGAEWLASAWDQNAGLHILSPAMSAVEEVAAGWVLDLLELPKTASVGFVTGATMANVTAMAAARHEVLRRVNWDVEARGLQGAPAVMVVAGAEAHTSIQQASRLIGLGASTIVRVPADDQGRMRPGALREVLAGIAGPAIVCAQVGNVNTGAFDPIGEIAAITRQRGAWLHVDGAFGLWAAVSPARRHLLDGVERADSWTVDGHKWLNVPYDNGIVIVAHAGAHRASMSQTAVYLTRAAGDERDGMDWTPEASRRARGLPVYAAIRSLGRQGLSAIVDRCCGCAARMADRLRQEPGIAVLNDVVLNQVLVRFNAPQGSNITPDVIARVQQEGVCWAGGTMWMNEPAMRISVSGWRTTEEDIDRSAGSIIESFRSSIRDSRDAASGR
jgi:glutamate/tyrosine decarboxylase-like PLP-dependent enzyme